MDAMPGRLIPRSYAAVLTPDDVEQAERDLAALLDQHDAETDPRWRDVLAGWIADDEAWLAEMREMVG
jgi:hypothetical protein